MVKDDSGIATVQVITDDLVVFACEVTFCHGTSWNIPNVFAMARSIFGDDTPQPVYESVFTMFKIRSESIANKEMEFNITSLLLFYVGEAESIFANNSNMLNVTCSNQNGDEYDSIIVRLGKNINTIYKAA